MYVHVFRIWLVSDHFRGLWEQRDCSSGLVPGLGLVRMGGCGCRFHIVWFPFEKHPCGQVVQGLKELGSPVAARLMSKHSHIGNKRHG